MSDNMYEILIIFSKTENYQINKETFFNINNSGQCCYRISYVVDPTRKELELLLQQKSFLCIVPCTQLTIYKRNGHKYQLNNYMISQLLENLDLEFWGCGYVSSLILHDKNICSYMSLGITKPHIISRYNYKQLLSEKTLNKFPIILDPIYSINSFSKKKYYANSYDEVKALVYTLFENDSDLEELKLCYNVRAKKNIVVTIIGNPPLSLSLVCEYDINFKDGKAICDNHRYTNLVSNSQKLFKEYKFRDFGEFIYAYDAIEDSFFLIDINCTNCLSTTVITAFQQYYEINNMASVINILLLV